MEAFHWNPCFVTGLTEVDAQHHRLVDIINQFGSLVMQEEAAVSALHRRESSFKYLANLVRTEESISR